MMASGHFAPREQKAAKIQHVLAEFLGEKNLRQLRCLDLGCGNGEIARHMASQFGEVIALDYVFELVRDAHRADSDVSSSFLQADGTCLPFADTSFDVVTCAQVYEHTAHAERLPREVERVLKPGGLCFFSGPNKVWPIEPHYLLPFLHWLPERLADWYLRATGKGDRFDIRPFTYWRLRRLWGRFVLHDCTAAVLREPDRFGLSTRASRLFARVPYSLLRLLYFLIPNYNWILVKPDAKQDYH
jgi:SAM-dependent methyltransferase